VNREAFTPGVAVHFCCSLVLEPKFQASFLHKEILKPFGALNPDVPVLSGVVHEN
jgi:hypothetical protein